MLTLFAAVLFAGAFAFALMIIATTIRHYGDKALAALTMEHVPLATMLRATSDYRPLRDARSGLNIRTLPGPARSVPRAA